MPEVNRAVLADVKSAFECRGSSASAGSVGVSPTFSSLRRERNRPIGMRSEASPR